MKEYWKEHYDQNSVLYADSLFKQVGKTVFGSEVEYAQLEIIKTNIALALQINSKDVVVDLCCGNGLITRLISTLARQVIGIDFSNGLLAAARRHCRADNVNFIQADVTRLEKEFFLVSRKYYMYEALQHFPLESLENLLETASSAGGRVLIYLGSIPDKDQLWNYYDTDEKRRFYRDSESSNMPHMGRWWLKTEIESISRKRGYAVSFFDQESSLYTASYRFDCLLELGL